MQLSFIAATLSVAHLESSSPQDEDMKVVNLITHHCVVFSIFGSTKCKAVGIGSALDDAPNEGIGACLLHIIGQLVVYLFGVERNVLGSPFEAIDKNVKFYMI